MKSKRLFFGLLALLPLCLSSPAGAETLTFLGKSFCPIRYDISWPFGGEAAKKEAQGSGIQANVYALPDEKENANRKDGKSDADSGSAMSRLRIISCPLKVGDKISEDEILVTYELPLENLMAEKQALSRAELDNAEHSLTLVESQLDALRQQQADLENLAAGQSVAPITVRLGAREIDALLLQRDSAREKLELARQRYDNAVIIAKSKFGKDQDIHKLPRVGYIRAPSGGYVLWLNSSLVPGMAFTKKASLISIGRLDPILVRASVHEIAAQKLKVGDPVSITFHALPGQTFQSTISKVDFVAQPAMLQQPSFFRIEISLPNPDLRIKEGMRCDVAVTLPDAAK